MNFLSGYRTYLIAAAAVIVTGLHGMGYMSDSLYTTIMGLLGGTGLATLHAALPPKQ